MTDDIVARLRDWAECEDDILIEAACADFHVAADKIEWMLAEIQQLKHDSTIFINERSDAICENFNFREENAELREKIERLRAAAEMALETLIGCCVSAGGVDDRKTILEAQDMLRAALEGEKKNDAST